MKNKQQQVTWVVDPVHTRIRFSVRYLLLTSVSGWFSCLEGIIMAGKEDFSDAEVQLTIFTSSVVTGNSKRDAHLCSADFLDVERYPVISFESTSVEAEDFAICMTGVLRIKDVIEVVRFKVIHNGTAVDQLGNVKAGFEMETAFNRRDLNISGNVFRDPYGALLSDEVKIFCDIELLKLT